MAEAKLVMKIAPHGGKRGGAEAKHRRGLVIVATVSDDREHELLGIAEHVGERVGFERITAQQIQKTPAPIMVAIAHLSERGFELVRCLTGRIECSANGRTAQNRELAI